ncbi:MAG: serine hydrolase [Chloroflexi bacterium]|nr:serine hydrolase [Chloroflexota bacterium]
MTVISSLRSQLQTIGNAYTGKWTYSLTDIESGDRIGFDEDDLMPTASLIKVPILIALYQAVEDGRISLDDRITFGDEHRFPGSGVLQRMSTGVEMSVRDAAVLMIIISDNVATNMVADLVGHDFINEQQRRMGLEKTTIYERWSEKLVGMDVRKTWVSTAAEMARNLEAIAKHEAVSEAASEDMLRIMRRNDYRHELSRELPWSEMNTLRNYKQNWVAEKGGASPGGIRTSGAIFHSERGYFVMSVFCEGGSAASGTEAGGTGRESEGNVLLGKLGYAAWRALAAPESG